MERRQHMRALYRIIDIDIIYCTVDLAVNFMMS